VAGFSSGNMLLSGSREFESSRIPASMMRWYQDQTA
jgi:hypothetical protein